MKRNAYKSKITGIQNLLCVIVAASLIMGLIVFPMAKEREADAQTETETLDEMDGISIETETESEELEPSELDNSSEENIVDSANEWARDSSTMFPMGIYVYWIEDGVQVDSPTHASISSLTATLYGRNTESEAWQLITLTGGGQNPITITDNGFAESGTNWWWAFLNVPMAPSLKLEITAVEGYTITYNYTDSNLLASGGAVSDMYVCYTYVSDEGTESNTEAETETEATTETEAETETVTETETATETETETETEAETETTTETEATTETETMTETSIESESETETETETETEESVLSSIEVIIPPNKTVYIEGENFNPAGLVIRATYSDGRTQDVTNLCTYFPNGALLTSNTTILISYSESIITKTTTQIVLVVAEETGSDTESGTEIETEIEAETETDTEEVIETETETEVGSETEEATEAGTEMETETETDTEMETETEAETDMESETEVEDAVLMSIEVITGPNKVIYMEGDTFDPAGMVIRATYSDGSSQNVTDMCTYFPNGVLTTSNTAILITYSESSLTETTTQMITVEAMEINETETEIGTEIEIATGTEIEIESETETEATIETETGSETEVMTETDTEAVPETETEATTETEPVSETETEATTETDTETVSETETEATTETETVSETETEAMTETETVPETETGVVPETETEATTEPETELEMETGSETETEIEAESNSESDIEGTILVSIEVVTPPDKTVYIEGEDFEPIGMLIMATYLDGSTRDITDLCTYFPNSSLTMSNTTILISYHKGEVTKTTTQAITVEEAGIEETETETGIESEATSETGTKIETEATSETGTKTETETTNKSDTETTNKTETETETKSVTKNQTAATGTASANGKSTSSVKAGDESDILMYTLLMGSGITGVIFIVYTRKRKSKSN